MIRLARSLAVYVGCLVPSTAVTNTIGSEIYSNQRINTYEMCAELYPEDSQRRAVCEQRIDDDYYTQIFSVWAIAGILSASILANYANGRMDDRILRRR